MKTEHIKVLVLEDESAHAEAIRRELESSKSKFEVKIVSTIKEYQQLISIDPPSIALTDMLLPDGSSLDMLRYPPEDQQFPILIMTSHGDEKVAVESMKKGALDYIVKSPQTFSEMPHILNRALKHWTLLQQQNLAETALRESEKKYSNLVENSNDGIVIIQNGVLVYANSRLLNLTGYLLEEVVGKPFTDFVSPECRSIVLERYKKRVEGQEVPERYEFDIVTKNGVKVPVENSASRFQYKGKIADMAILRDIRERRHAEEEHRSSEERFHLLVESAPDAIFVQTGGKFAYVNAAAMSLFGAERFEQLVGQSILDRFEPDSRERVDFGIKTLKQEIAVAPLAEEKILRFDGKEVDVEVSAVPFLYQGAHGALVFMHDITQRKQSQEKLRQSESLYNLITDSVTDTVWLLDLNLKTTYISPSVAKLLGYPLEEVYASRLEKLVTSESFQLVQAALNQEMVMIEASPNYNFHRKLELQFYRKDGTKIWSENTFSLIRDSTSKPISILSEGRDITERKTAEEALGEWQHLLDTVANASPALVWMSGLDKLRYYFNKPWLDFTGRDLKQEMGNGWTEGVHPDDLHYCISTYFEALNSRQALKMEYRLRRCDGEYRWIIDSGIPMYDKESRFSGFIGSCLDITEHKQSVEAMMTSEEKYRSLINNIKLGIYRSTPGDKGRYLEVNPAMEEITGYSRRELLSMPVSNLFVDPKERGRLSRLVLASLGKVTRISKLRKKDGKEIMASITLSRILDNAGSKVFFDGLLEDVTERVLSETAIKESEAKYRNLFETMAQGVIYIDSEGKTISANPAAQMITGRTLEQMQAAETVKTRIPAIREDGSELDQEIYPAILALKTGREIHEVVMGIYNPLENQRRWISVNAVPQFNKGNKAPYQVYSTFTDITELKKAQTQALEVETLTRLSKAKSELLSNVSHELRTPLASIKGFIETLIETDVKWSKKQQLEFLKEADREVNVLTFLIRDLLDMSRIESGRLTLDKRDCTIEEILASAQSRLSTITANHTLVVKLPPDLPLVNADKLRIAQVITNLVENASKFSTEGTRITIEARTQPGNVVVSVADQGVGMSKEVIGRLFDRFYQAEQVVSGKTKGTGLGLAICRGIIESHFGKIWVESDLEKGSKFFFTLPLPV